MTDTVSDTRMEQAHQQSLPLRNIPEWYQTSDQCHGEKEGGEVTRSAWGETGGGGPGYFIYTVSKCEPVLTEGERTEGEGKSIPDGQEHEPVRLRPAEARVAGPQRARRDS